VTSAPEILEDRAPIGLVSSVLPWSYFERERERAFFAAGEERSRERKEERRRGGEAAAVEPFATANGSRVPLKSQWRTAPVFHCGLSYHFQGRLVTIILVVCAKRNKEEACTSFYLATPVNTSDATCGK
jgi:hypothetical protein